MLASAMNFAIGFFGYPFEKQYQQLITVEAKGVSLVRLWKVGMSLKPH